MDQWQEHLDLANHVRRSNRKLKDELAGMSREDAIERVMDIIDQPSGPACGMQIGQLLQAIPRYGETKMGEILTRAGAYSTPMSPMRKVRALTARQRLALTMELYRRQT
jgi:hypothetical protein